MNPKESLLLGAVLCLVLVVVGAGLLAFSLGPVERSEVKMRKSLIVKANEYAAQEFGLFPSWYDYVVYFRVLNGNIKSCAPLTMNEYSDWQAGRYTPNLTETENERFDYKNQIKYGEIIFVYMFTRYLLFFNQDSYDKEIQISVDIYWDEINTTNLTIGATLMAAAFFGLGIASARLVHSTKANPR